MEQTNTAPLDLMGATPERSGFLNVLCILSFIGSGLWALGSLIGIFASTWIMSLLGMAVEQGLSDNNSGLTESQREDLGQAAGILGSVGTGVIIAVFIVSLILALLSLMGVAKMWKLQKSGFTLYVIGNGIYLLLMLISVNVLGIIVTGAFIGMYAANRKALIY
ncbi:MAG: hypothetical protein SH856_11430 [Flavobacteriales bacterium]|nr:hypothetical protein [Flavobacteriales bacterium]